MTTVNPGATGTDGQVPVYEPSARWTTWSIHEIYLGKLGENRYIPKVNDHVIDPETNQRWRVASLDPTTYVPELTPIEEVFTGDLSEIDVLLGVGPGTPSDTYRVFIDTSVMPHILAVDARLKIHGSMCDHAKIFKGSALHGNEQVISALYDNSGNLLGNAIPLELVASNPTLQNIATKCVPPCHTTENLPDGETVTLVAYAANGHVVSKRQLLVENTSFIRSVDSSVKYVTGVSLKTPFLSKANPKLIQFPLNVPLSGLGLIGVVHYSDGSELEMPVDGTKFAVYGFENFVSTIVSQKLPIVLRYNLSPDEIVYGASVAAGRFITEDYSATTLKSDGAYSVKLFCYPEWIDEVSGYRLRWYLYTLERQLALEVTPHVRINTNTGIFRPLEYGVNQHLSVTINLKDVNGAFKSYNHVQAVDVVLAAPGSVHDVTNWLVGFEPGQNPLFGANNQAITTFVNQGNMKLKIDLGLSDYDDWLERMYFRTRPLIDGNREVQAPKPTHFALVINGTDVEFPISQWNSEILLTDVLTANSTLFVKFFFRTPDNDIQLSVAALPVAQQN